ncbi:MAG: hypothetical protein WCG01_04900 [bacterium]
MKQPKLMNENGEALTLWFREHEMTEIKRGIIKSSIRYGDRTENTHDQKGGYKVGSKIKLLILNQDGEFEDFYRQVEIKSVQTKLMQELSEDDFVGSPSDQNNKDSLCSAFRTYYGELTCKNELISVIKFDYN